MHKSPHYRNTDICCARIQDKFTEERLDQFVKEPAIQLRNLPRTYAHVLDGMSAYDIREMFYESDVPFKVEPCVRGNITCCGTCMTQCYHRCPQDVLYRAYLICGYLLDSPEDAFQERWENSSFAARMLYKELTSSSPSYKRVMYSVREYISRVRNKELKMRIRTEGMTDNPNKMSYAPTFAYEVRRIKLPNGDYDVRYIPKADPNTGELAMLHWPASGVCPYCIPYGTVDRNRIKGPNRTPRRRSDKDVD